MGLDVPPACDSASARPAAARRERALDSMHCPVIAYGTNCRGPLPGVLHQRGFDDALRKPCNDEEMRECLRRWCADCFVPPGLSAAQRRLAQAGRTSS